MIGARSNRRSRVRAEEKTALPSDLRKASEAVNFLEFSCIFLLTCYITSYTIPLWDTYRECN